MRKTILILLSISLSVFLIYSCTSTKEEFKGFDRASLDTTHTPQNDFYHNAVGGWLKNNPVPEDQSIWSGFNVLREKTKKEVRTIIDEVSNDPGDDPASVCYKVGAFYNVGMDSTKIDKESWQPLADEFERIDAISDKTGLIEEIAHIHIYTASPLFYFMSSPDSKNSNVEIAEIWQAGLGLPDRDYYLEDDDRSKEVRTKYVEHMEKMFQLLGDDETACKKQAESVMDLETRLAKASNSRVENRDPKATYNKFTTGEIKSKYPGFDWDLYLNEIGAGDPGHIDISQPEFISEVSKMIGDVSLPAWKSYLRWKLINSMAPYLSSDFVEQDFAFYGKFLEGREKQQTRWKRVQNSTNRALGNAVGKLYVEKYFPPEAKERAVSIVDNLLESMGESINNAKWMSDATKKEALAKLDSFGVKIGYPDKWKDYSDLEVKVDSYVQNIIRSNYFSHQDMLEDINKPVKEWEWGMNPHTVNAYYNPSQNEIAFPAGILQFPFYDYRADDAINYGAMGAVIGHEITHGFDDQGRQYDEEGNIRDWWTEEDSKRFDERAQKLVEQYDNYVAIDSMTINGEMTLGENIADLGGLTVSYNAFKKTKQFKEGEKIDGFNPRQRFFLGWAQVWKNNIRDEELMRRLKTDVHSTGQWRVLGPLSNIPEFFATYDVKPGDKMKRDEPVKIW